MFFRKNKDDNEKVDNFDSFNDENLSDTTITDAYEVEDSEDLNVTRTLNTEEIANAIEASDSDTNIFKKLISTAKTYKIQTALVCIVLVASIIAGAGYAAVQAANPLRRYVQYAASKENLVSTMEAEGVLETGDKYEIVSLVSGKIAESNYEVGDKVSAGDVLYKLDDTEAKLVLERAKNELSKADNSGGSSVSADSGRIIASDNGTIESLNVKQGSVVAAGSQIGKIKGSDGKSTPIISYVSGTVSVVSASVGRNVSSGQLIASVKLSNSQSSNSTFDKKTGEIDVQAAEKQLEAYTVKSPIDGVIIEKNNKSGDNVGDANSYKPMMVVLDTSKLYLTFGVDESRISEVEKGQSVTITCDSMPDTKFSGEVAFVGLEGKTNEDGKLMFDVKIAITEPEDLKAGMKVKAKIILDTSNNATAVPQDALFKSDGQNALVLVKNDSDTTDKDVSETIDNQLDYPDVKVPDGCSLLKVTYGISDGTNVQILSGIKVGDIVVYNPKADYGEFIKSTADHKVSSADDDSRKNDINADDEIIERQVEEQMGNILKNSNL